jgi:hypothetical protein
MGKIKGWTRSNKERKDFKEMKWDSDHSAMSVSVVNDGDIWRWWLIDTFEYSEEMGASRDKKFIIESAMNYMRSHPNG